MLNQQRRARWLALHLLPRTGPVTLQRALDHVHRADALFEISPDHLKALLPDAAVSALMAFRQTDTASPLGQQVACCLDQLDQFGDDLLVRDDPDYPGLLAQIPTAPVVLFLRGRRELLNEPQLAVVGARSASRGGRETAHRFALEIANAGITVTSGLALGIDGAAHRGALECSGNTIAVMGTGLDEIYPQSHESLARQIAMQGLLITEMVYGTSPLPGNFPRRNRIISGLSLGVLVVEAGLKSGSLGTAQQALEQGREVFAIPGAIHNPLARGCHRLLRDGARLVESIDDILPELPPIFEAQQLMGRSRGNDDTAHQLSLSTLTDEEQRILIALGNEKRDAETLMALTGMNIERLLETVLMMELQGVVESVPGGYQATVIVDSLVS